MLNRVLIVGASLAGLRAAEALRSNGFAGDLELIGAEAHEPYDRPPLSKEVLTSAKSPELVRLRQAEGLGAKWHLGKAAVGLDLDAGSVELTDGSTVGFDGLIIATGTIPRRLPMLDVHLPGVYELRTLPDALRLREALAKARRVVVVGAGFIGMEVASSAINLGAAVSVVSLELPLAAAGRVATQQASSLLESAGVTVFAPAHLAEVQVRRGELVVVLESGLAVAADVVVSAVGVRPATDWLAGSGLDVTDGVLCDERLCAVGAERVTAAGDIVRWPNARCGGALTRVEHWSNATGTARAAAAGLVGRGRPYGDLPLFWSDHFGMRMQSIGLPGYADTFEIVAGSPGGALAAEARRHGELIGGVCWDMPRELVGLRQRLPDPLTLTEVSRESGPHAIRRE